MEFLGAVYYFNSSSIAGQIFVCRRYKQEQPSGLISGFHLFQFEIKQQVLRENPGSPFSYIIHVIGKAWRELTPARRDDYYRRASESKPTRRMTKRCTGRLKLRAVNGQPITSADGLIDYAPHSEELSISTDKTIR